MSNDKAEILTEAEVNDVERSALACDPVPHDLLRYLSTIRQMAGLLERWRWCESLHDELIANETKALLARYKGDVMKTRDRKEHTDGTIESLRTVVNTIREYALPELPPNELGQIPFMRAVFESVIDEIEASISRQETDKETAAANERYIFAIPALCRGENVTCAMHVSQPIATLRTQLAAKERECEELKQELCRANYLTRKAIALTGGEKGEER